LKKTYRANSTRGSWGEEMKERTSLVVKEGFFINPVVMKRAWSWFTCSAVVHFESVGMGEAHGWCEEELRQTTINGSNFQIFWL